MDPMTGSENDQQLEQKGKGKYKKNISLVWCMMLVKHQVKDKKLH